MLKKKEKSALKMLLETGINNRNEINLNEISPKIGEYIHRLWKSYPIQRCFLKINAQYQGVLYSFCAIIFFFQLCMCVCFCFILIVFVFYLNITAIQYTHTQIK